MALQGCGVEGGLSFYRVLLWVSLQTQEGGLGAMQSNKQTSKQNGNYALQEMRNRKNIVFQGGITQKECLL